MNLFINNNFSLEGHKCVFFYFSSTLCVCVCACVSACVLSKKAPKNKTLGTNFDLEITTKMTKEFYD